MGVRFPGVATTAIVNGSCPILTETVVLTTPPLSPPLDNAQVYLIWSLKLNTGNQPQTLSYTLRRGTTNGGAVVGFQAQASEVASVILFRGGCYVDTPGVVAGQQYSLTLNITTASGTATAALDGCLMAFVL
jgi:hypothetical protein